MQIKEERQIVEKEGKIIVLDYGMFIHRAGYASKNNPNIPPTYTAINMIVASLRRIGVSPFDKIIVACDGKGNWRKDFETDYKANRAELRKKSGLDWGTMYNEFNELLERIEKGTSWHTIKLDKIEADDIASVACRYFEDKEIVLCSFDSDWEMLWFYSNVKIFSPLIKYKSNGRGSYKVPPKNFDVYKFIAKKINKEVADNLLNPILNEADYDKRKIVINLLELPDFVENQIKEVFDNLPVKEPDLNYIRSSSIRKKIGALWNDKSKIVKYEDCVAKEEKKKLKKKKKKKK